MQPDSPPATAYRMSHHEYRVSQPIFRQATTEDIPAMSAIRLSVRENVLSNPSRITERMYRDYLESLGRGWVAEVDGVVAGFCYADTTDTSIWALFIAPEHEGRGYAKALLALAVGWLFASGAQQVRLSTGTGTRAERFYAMQGWTRELADDKDAFYLLARPAEPLRRVA